MDKVISEKIATKIILSMISASADWEVRSGPQGTMLVKGGIMVMVDVHEIYVRDDSGSQYQLFLNENDILRIQDAAYDIANDSSWDLNHGLPVRIALCELNL